MLKCPLLLAFLIMSGTAQAASPNCDSALVLDTGSAWSTTRQDWRLATLVKKEDYEEYEKGGSEMQQSMVSQWELTIKNFKRTFRISLVNPMSH